MSYMSCPRCGLTVALRAEYLTLERCPRCVAKARVAVPMFITGERSASARRTTVAGALVIRTERVAQTLVLALSGELDLASAPALERQLQAAETSGLARVVVDLRELEFLDSAGLHVLLEAHRRWAESGLQLVLRPGPRSVQRMFELTGTVSALRFES